MKRLLQQRLPPAGPAVHDIMRLGVDCAAGRLRRIMTMKQRRRKAGNKTNKLHVLKILRQAVRLKLYKGSVQAKISWGHEDSLLKQGSGSNQQWPARCVCEGQGNMDILYDVRPRHKDPAYEAFVSQVRVYHRFFGNWPEHLHRDLAKSWKVHKERLQKAKHPWRVARGPVAALICTCVTTGGAQSNMIFGLVREAMGRITSPST